jgi:hypothetical protein
LDTEKPAQKNDSGCVRLAGIVGAGRYREIEVSVTDLSPAADAQRVTMLSYDMGHQHLPLSRSSRLTDFLLSPLCELPFLVLSCVEFHPKLPCLCISGNLRLDRVIHPSFCEVLHTAEHHEAPPSLPAFQTTNLHVLASSPTLTLANCPISSRCLYNNKRSL